MASLETERRPGGDRPGIASVAGSAAPDPATVDGFLDLLCRIGAHKAGREGARKYFDDIFRGIDFAGRRMLDIGGGNGMHSYYAALMGAREVVCLEPEAAGNPSGATSELGRIRAALPDLPVRLETCTLQQYCDTGGFDIIVMTSSINHVDEEACTRLLEDPAARAMYLVVFAQLAALGRPGAKIVITDCARRNFFAALGIKNPTSPTIEWHKHQQPETWAVLLQEAGFTDPRIRWLPLYRFGNTAQRLLANKVAAYFLKGAFRLEMRKAL